MTNVGTEMATYMYDQDIHSPATAGSRITPMDQYVSCRVTTTVLYVPAVISETVQDKQYIQLTGC